MGPWCTQQMGAGEWVGMVAFWVVVLGLAIWAVSRLFPADPAPDARAVLESRLASGEIDPGTYHLIRAELDGPPRVEMPVQTKGER